MHNKPEMQARVIVLDMLHLLHLLHDSNTLNNRDLTHVDGFDGNSRRAKLASDVVVHRFAPSVDSQAGVAGLGEDAILLNGCWTRCNFLTLASIRRAASPMIVSAKKKGAALYEPTTRTGRTVACILLECLISAV